MKITIWIRSEGGRTVTLRHDTKYESRDYAEQMCREVLAAKGVLETRTGASVGYAYKWDTLPGKHDKLDTHAMAHAAAAYRGVLATEAGGTHLATKGDGSAAPAKNKRKVYNG